MNGVVVVKRGSRRAVIAAGLRGPVGAPGAQGDDGAPFQVDATGLLANRGAFDAEDEGFSYLATDTGVLYFRQGAAGSWSDPVPFQGPAGDSAYQIAVNNGFVGTELEWLASLEGADGTNGTNGISITGASIDGGGHLLLTLSNSTVLDAGYVVGPPGANGVDGANGTDGVDGAPGADGDDGRGIASMAIDGSNHLIITYTDSTTQDVGLIPGAGGSASWGSIGGTLADQIDLVAALADKANSADLATVAETGSYNDLADKPTIPSNTDAVSEGATNLYHTASRVRAVVLTGLSLADSTVVAATDSVLQAIGKLGARLATAFSRANHTGTQPASTISDFSAAAKAAVTQCIPIACSDETTALSAGVAKVTFRMPFGFTLSAVRASLTTAQASGSILTVDINEGGTSILSTKLTIDNTEKTSTTAAAAAVISDTALADDAEITVDIDQIGDGTAKGLKVYLIGVPT